MNTISRITPIELSRTQIDNQTIQAQYKAGYGFFIVNSKFSGDKSLSDLFFEIIRKKREIILNGQHENSTFASL